MKRYAKNSIIKNLAVTDVNNLGYGVGRTEETDGPGVVVFVKGAVEKDIVDARVIKAASSYLVAKVERFIVYSELHRAPACPAAGRCGGCVYRHIDYEYEKKLKRKYVEAAFRKAGVPAEVAEVTSAKTERYRNKAEYPVGKGYEVGFFSAKSHRIAPLPEGGCLLQSEIIDSILRTVRDYIENRRVPVYDETEKSGLLRHIFIRDGGESGQQMVALVVTSESFARKYPDFASYVMERHPGVVSVMMNINRADTNVILGEKSVALAGQEYMTARMCSLDFKLSLESFFQVNTPAAELLYGKALELAEAERGDKIVDLFCGVGSIGLYMLANLPGCSLSGVEIVPRAIENARENARLNRIENARFICADANDEAVEGADILIVDPPRKGCAERLIRRMAEASAKKIIYISCNPDTLARDCALLGRLGYVPGTVYPFDLFPGTGHVETVVLLSQQKPDDTIEIDLDLDELDATTAETKATYEEIKAYVWDKHHLKVSSLYISQVKRKCGLEVGQNYNLSKSENPKVPKCPPEKEAAIMDALKHFQMI